MLVFFRVCIEKCQEWLKSGSYLVGEVGVAEEGAGRMSISGEFSGVKGEQGGLVETWEVSPH